MTVISDWRQRVSLLTINSTILGVNRRNFSFFRTSTAFYQRRCCKILNLRVKSHLINSFEASPGKIFKQFQDFIGVIVLVSIGGLVRALVARTGADGGEGGHRDDDVQHIVSGNLHIIITMEMEGRDQSV